MNVEEFISLKIGQTQVQYAEPRMEYYTEPRGYPPQPADYGYAADYGNRATVCVRSPKNAPCFLGSGSRLHRCSMLRSIVLAAQDTHTHTHTHTHLGYDYYGGYYGGGYGYGYEYGPGYGPEYGYDYGPAYAYDQGYAAPAAYGGAYPSPYR